jgi:Uma2 family endonuclease
VLARGPDDVRAPDLAFIALERLPDGRLPDGFVEGAPDLAIEILLPNDRVMETEAKVEAYLTAGARAVWVVNPRARHLTVHTPDGLARILRETDDLATDVLPGFRCRVAEIFE